MEKFFEIQNYTTQTLMQNKYTQFFNTDEKYMQYSSNVATVMSWYINNTFIYKAFA